MRGSSPDASLDSQPDGIPTMTLPRARGAVLQLTICADTHSFPGPSGGADFCFSRAAEGRGPWRPGSDRPRGSQELLFLLPDEIMSASATDLAEADRAVAINSCRCRAHLHWAGAADGDRGHSHVQLAVRPNRSSKHMACFGGILRLTVLDGQRTGCPVRTRSHSAVHRRVHRIDCRRRDKPICTIKRRYGGWSRWRLCIHGCDQTEKSNDR